MGNVNFSMKGFNELEKYMIDMGKVPQKCVTKAARLGSKDLLAAVKAEAPVDTGQLRKGIVMKPERSRKRGKKVFQIVFSAHMNDVFVKTSKKGKRYYYPASMEYGFITRNGGYVPGYRFMRNTADRMSDDVKSKITGVLAEEIDKLR